MRHGRIIPEAQGDVSNRGLWEIQTDDIIGVRFGDSHIKTYVKNKLDTLLSRWEQMKKDKHGSHWHNQRKRFYQFVLSIYGVLGKDSQFVLANLSSLMAAKMEEPIFHIKGWVNNHIAIEVARSFSQKFKESWVPSPLHNQEPDWESDLGLGLVQ